MKLQIKAKDDRGFFIGRMVNNIFFEKDKVETPDLMEFGPACFSSYDSAIAQIMTWPANINDYEIITI